MALFTDSVYWETHTLFVAIFEFVPLLMLDFAFTGRFSKRMRWKSFGLFLLIYSQYFTANLPALGWLHPVMALLLFWLSIAVAKQAAKGGRSV